MVGGVASGGLYRLVEVVWGVAGIVGERGGWEVGGGLAFGVVAGCGVLFWGAPGFIVACRLWRTLLFGWVVGLLAWWRWVGGVGLVVLGWWCWLVWPFFCFFGVFFRPRLCGGA